MLRQCRLFQLFSLCRYALTKEQQQAVEAELEELAAKQRPSANAAQLPSINLMGTADSQPMHCVKNVL